MDIDDVLSQVNKKFGTGSLVKLSDTPPEVPRLPSGNIELDMILNGGYPKGCIGEFFGPEGSGKSTLAMMAAAQSQKEGRLVGYIDAENSLSREMAEACGLDVESMILGQPPHGEAGLEMAEELLRVPEVGVIVVDSVAALTPQAVIRGDFDDAHIGVQARMMSQGLQKINSTMLSLRTDTIVLFVNQLREKIGSVGFGPATTTPGGRALKFYSSVRLDVRRTGQIKGKEGEPPVGQTVQISVAKNRSAPPFRKVNLELRYQGGISNAASVLNLCLANSLIVQKGAWFADAETGQSLAQGRTAMIELFSHQPDLFETYRKGVLDELSEGTPAAT